MTRWVWTVLAGALAAMLAAVPASAATQTFTPVADARVESSHPASNYGRGTRLIADASPVVRSYLRFDVRLPAGATVSAATLRLATTSSTARVGYSVNAVADVAWGESTITYNNAPGVGTKLATSATWSTTGYKIVALPASAVGSGLRSFAVTTASTTALNFQSREAASQPQLVVDYSVPAIVQDPVPSAPAVQTPAHGPSFPSAGAYLGAYANPDAANGQSRDEVLALESLIGRRLAIGHHYRDWTSSFNLTSSTQADEGWDVANGRIPMISQSESGYSGPLNILDAINNGSQDALIRAHADAIRAFGHPILYRLFWEMNGDWNGYNETHASTPGTTDGAAKFVAAWRRIHDIFQAAGATNAGFVWCPDVSDHPAVAENHWTRYYPGDAYVDWVCADGYNRGTAASWSAWKTFGSIFAALYGDYPAKPFMVGETGSVESGGDKGAWISDAAATMQASMPRLRAFVWFDRGATAAEPYDWRVDSSQASADAFRALARSPYFSP